MDPFVAPPEWGGYIVWYFFLGGIAAGAFAVARMVDLVGTEDDRRAVRGADYLAFPLVALCGLLLTVDLNRPERFWHMLVQSETYRPMFKWWSPMSVGSWGLTLFGAFSFASFLGALAADGRWGLGRWAPLASRLRRGPVGVLYAVAAAGSAFFLGSYTGALLTATNQPVWAQTTWLAPLFLASAASTGLAALLLWAAGRGRDLPHAVIARLEWADAWAIGLEALLLLILFASLDAPARRSFAMWPGVLIPAFVVPVGLVLPLFVRRLRGRTGVIASAGLILLGGFALRAAIVGMPGPWLATGYGSGSHP